MDKECTHCLKSQKDSEFYKKGTGRSSCCKTCTLAKHAKVARDKKLRVIALLGGKCHKCGYCKCLSALEFHHIDPSTKAYDWGQLKDFSWKKIVEEIKKCVLLCSNCHKEHHFNHEMRSDLDDNKLLTNKIESTGKCLTCNTPVFNTIYCSVPCVRLAQRKVKRPTKEQLKKDLESLSYCAIGRKYGVSDNSIRLWQKSYGIE